METKTMTSTEDTSSKKRKNYITLPEEVQELTRCADQYAYGEIYQLCKSKEFSHSLVRDFADFSVRCLRLNKGSKLVDACLRTLDQESRKLEDMEGIFHKLRAKISLNPIEQYKFTLWVNDFYFNYTQLNSPEGKGARLSSGFS